MKRRDFMRTASGATLAAGATVGAAGPAAASAEGGDEGDEEGQEVPDFGSYLDDANGFDESDVEDARGEDEVTISVGAGDGYAFDPAGVWVAPGTTITWEWTGQGGGHNVAIEEGDAGFEHPDTVSEEGYTHEYEVTEEDAGINTYKCEPHEGQGMKGGVAVGDDVETTTVSADAGLKEPEEFGVDIHEHWVGVTVVLMVVVSLVFTFFMLKYSESPHTSGGG